MKRMVRLDNGFIQLALHEFEDYNEGREALKKEGDKSLPTGLSPAMQKVKETQWVNRTFFYFLLNQYLAPGDYEVT